MTRRKRRIQDEIEEGMQETRIPIPVRKQPARRVLPQKRGLVKHRRYVGAKYKSSRVPFKQLTDEDIRQFIAAGWRVNIRGGLRMFN